VKSHNRPERERFPCFKTRISVVKKVKPTAVAGTGERFALSEPQSVERTQIFIKFDLNEYSVLAALLVHGKDFCGNGGHLRHFLRLTSPEMAPVFKASGTVRHRRRIER
jgi:hypothetical protein